MRWANVMEPDWQWSFFGPNYGRLRQIKARYDPARVFWCLQCVGSEDWTQTLSGRLCRAYDPLTTA
ncbi:putative FAD-linked oxidoreductase-like protein 16 [Colletotrichum chlorophyti]|uniref:Putative FAD-linked oxidoreductase-like protein 16 n=1 Tax=Colletotrichum chlorophyti TaxID=708187 RepID=A0A1Q8RR23_9PEZI|nr:putative FAD-linked oxidoreductase-like protein 16 [Colletotrichum chlorophyti]